MRRFFDFSLPPRQPASQSPNQRASYPVKQTVRSLDPLHHYLILVIPIRCLMKLYIKKKKSVIRLGRLLTRLGFRLGRLSRLESF